MPVSGLNEAPSPAGGGSNLARRGLTRFWWILLLVLLVTIVITVASLRDLYQLTARERMLLGAWEWQDDPGMVLYFDDRRKLTYAEPPFTAPLFEEWWIDEGQRIHFTDLGRGFLKGIGRLLSPTDTYRIRFVDRTAVLTMGDGSEKVLVPYTGPGVEKLRGAD